MRQLFATPLAPLLRRERLRACVARKAHRLGLLALQDLGEGAARIRCGEDSLDTFAAHHDRGAVLVVRHDLHDLVEHRVARHDERPLVHGLAHRELGEGDVCDGLEHVKVALADDPDEVTVVDDRKMPDVVISHQAIRLGERRIALDRPRLRCHVSGYRWNQHAHRCSD